jgi:predicted nucleotidyltransferase
MQDITALEESMDREQVIQLLATQRPQIDRLGVRSLSLFGSMARGENRPESDADFLVEFEGRATSDCYMDLKFLLEDLLGMRADLVTHKARRPEMRSTVEEGAIRLL